VTFHFIWVHQEKFNQPYVEAMGGYWKVCNARSAAEKAAWPHRECMAARMQDSREADAAKARKTGTAPSPNPIPDPSPNPIPDPGPNPRQGAQGGHSMPTLPAYSVYST